jgi:predicted HicB family RNase H-like nuclease
MVGGGGAGRMLTYKKYIGVAEVDAEAGIISGRVIGLRDAITFQGETVREADQAFRDSVDAYLESCASRGEEPEKPFSGKFLLRLPPELHRTLAVAAESQGLSLNAYVLQLLGAPPRGARREGGGPAAGKGTGRGAARPSSGWAAGKSGGAVHATKAAGKANKID